LIAATAAILLLLGVAARLVYLQVIDHAHFVTLSENNRLRLESVVPTRGLIYDRNGVLLAENRPTYQLEIIPEQVHDLKDTLQRLGKLVTLAPADIRRCLALAKAQPAFKPIAVRRDLSAREVARFAVNRQRFPGVDIHARLTREYPLGSLTAHAVGRVGAISEKELARVPAGQYSGTSLIGKIGTEAAYEKLLHGLVGYRRVETNAGGRVVRTVSFKPPVAGDDLYLSLDVNLQQIAGQALGTHTGAVVAIDPRNGGVLAFVSKPSYDPNLFVGGIAAKAYAKLRHAPGRPLFNRAIRGQYPPGSTLKPFLGLAGLFYGAITPEKQIFCPGYFQIPGHAHRYHDWKQYGHGQVNLRKAIAQSCDVYFYQLALALDIEHMHDFLAEFGFGEPTGIDLTGERAGILPSRDWKRRVRHQPWYPGETVITGIGQGYTLVTPLQLADAAAAMGAHGLRFKPHLLHATRDPKTGVISTFKPAPLPPIKLHDPRHWQTIIDDMKQVVTSPYGTAHRIDGAKYAIAGKTGTAQVYSLDPDQVYDTKVVPNKLRDHALFIAFAPADKPRIAVAVIVEHGGEHHSLAVPIARKVMDAYLLKPDGARQHFGLNSGSRKRGSADERR
jgi:penicillin-binding protein 2